MNETVQERFSKVVNKIPHHPCIIHGDHVYSFRETNRRVNAMANAFLDMGIKKGDRIAAGLFNCPQLIETWMAAFKIGAVAVNINYRLEADEIRHVLEDSGTSILVLDDELVDKVEAVRSSLPGLEQCIVVGDGAPQSMSEYEALIDTYPDMEPLISWDVRGDDLAQLFYTGGTTGMPKGVMHTHESNLAIIDSFTVNGIFMGAFRAVASSQGYKEVIDSWLGILLGLAPVPVPRFLVSGLAALLKTEPVRRLLSLDKAQDLIKKGLSFIWSRPPMFARITPMKHLIASPIIHGVAWWGGGLICPVTGFTLVLLSSKHFDPEEALRCIEKHRVNMLGIVGDKFSRMLLSVPDIDSYDTSSLAMIGSSGAHWTPEVKAELHRHFPQALLIDHLGLTESPAVSTGVYFKGDEYGKLGPGVVEIKVVDEQGKAVAVGETGTILVKAPSSGLGYYRDEEKSRETWRDEGWVCSGDSGTVDEQGNIVVYGRGSEVISSGGIKIWVEEVETVIARHPKVKDVVVFGVPDPEWGESVMAVVVLHSGEEAGEQEIIEHCRENMAGFKKPRYVRFEDELPELPFGKIRRGVVKAMFADYLAKKETSETTPPGDRL